MTGQHSYHQRESYQPIDDRQQNLHSQRETGEHLQCTDKYVNIATYVGKQEYQEEYSHNRYKFDRINNSIPSCSTFL